MLPLEKEAYAYVDDEEDMALCCGPGRLDSAIDAPSETISCLAGHLELSILLL